MFSAFRSYDRPTPECVGKGFLKGCSMKNLTEKWASCELSKIVVIGLVFVSLSAKAEQVKSDDLIKSLTKQQTVAGQVFHLESSMRASVRKQLEEQFPGKSWSDYSRMASSMISLKMNVFNDALRNHVKDVFIHQGDAYFHGDQGENNRFRNKKSKTLWVTFTFDDGTHARFLFDDIDPDDIEELYKQAELIRTKVGTLRVDDGPKGDGSLVRVSETVTLAKLKDREKLFALLGNRVLTNLGNYSEGDRVLSVDGRATSEGQSSATKARHVGPAPGPRVEETHR